MIALLPGLFRRFRAKEPTWIESDELQRRLTAGERVMLLDVRQPDEFTSPPGHLPGAVNVPLTALAGRTPIWRNAGSRSWSCARPIGDRRVQQRSCWLPVSRMSPFSAAARMAGISAGWRWNDRVTTVRAWAMRTDWNIGGCVAIQRRPPRRPAGSAGCAGTGYAPPPGQSVIVSKSSSNIQNLIHINLTGGGDVRLREEISQRYQALGGWPIGHPTN